MIVTHNMQQAMRVADKTAFFSLDETRIGTLIEYDDTDKLFSRPADKRTEATSPASSAELQSSRCRLAAALRQSRGPLTLRAAVPADCKGARPGRAPFGWLCSIVACQSLTDLPANG